MKRERILACVLAVFTLVVVSCKKKEEPGIATGTSAASPAPTASPSVPGPTPDNELVVDRLVVDRQAVEVAHSKFDGGRSEDLFDDDPKTLARTEYANPATVELRFANPKLVKSLKVTTGSMDIGLTVTVTPQEGQPRVSNKEFRQLPNDPTVSLDLDPKGILARKVRVEIKNLNGGDGHIHIRTLHLS